MSSMPLLRERERTRTNHRGTERNEKTRQREEGGSVRVVGGAVMRVWGGGVGSASGRAGSSARRVARDGSARGDRGRSIVGSIAVDRDGSFPPRRSTLARRSSRDASGREGAGAIDAGAGRGRGARATTHIWRSFSFCTRAYTSGSASLRGLRASGKTASCVGRGRAGWGGGIWGRRTTVSRDERRQPRSRAGGGDVGRRWPSIEARATAPGRVDRGARAEAWTAREGDDAPWCSSWACGVARCAAGECAAVPIRTRRATPGSGAFRRFQLRKVGKSASGVRGLERAVRNPRRELQRANSRNKMYGCRDGPTRAPRHRNTHR